MGALKNLFNRAMDDTPARGRKLASIGFGIGASGVGVHAALKFFDPNLVEYLPEDQRLAYILVTKGMEYLPLVLEALGGLLYVWGSIQTNASEKPKDGQSNS